ncbi:hypothetical protein TNCT_248341 [Trichonephila clavata]|uniref:Uncharacterized protein n=1 Tax=Trichonephila clavata TaxID=2740835 RepID=A0A8X6HMK8_TRICU|nr:hypothetical protein TNCT_248341 [Trichonephila clavata]
MHLPGSFCVPRLIDHYGTRGTESGYSAVVKNPHRLADGSGSSGEPRPGLPGPSIIGSHTIGDAMMRNGSPDHGIVSALRLSVPLSNRKNRDHGLLENSFGQIQPLISFGFD